MFALHVLPGHEGRFALLLPKFPFPADAPARAELRGAGVAEGAKRPPAGTFLPYATIYHNLLSLDALQRVVIIDSCQAEAAVDDPGVRALDQLRALERESRQTRTAFLLASRRGESAGEAGELKHGLLTYALLRGAGAQGLAPIPPGLTAFRDNPNADYDGDGTVTTGELRRYVDRVLPELDRALTRRVRDGGQPRGPVPARPAPDPGRSDAARLVGTGGSFPLVVLPAEAPGQ